MDLNSGNDFFGKFLIVLNWFVSKLFLTPTLSGFEILNYAS